MEIYLVGGAVRDELLGLEVKERDWVVTGATPEQMLALGYRQVGRDFPVFLHPKTHEEYALARSERKMGPGYRGFAVQSHPSISLEEDLRRRDLSINAMARNAAGELIDPYAGLADLKAGILRHVSLAFGEDPVRLLRIARFAARFARFGFVIADETWLLLRQMVEKGEVNHLVAERVWQELAKALAEPNPERFFEVLCECKAMDAILPECTGLCERLSWLSAVTAQCTKSDIRFAAMCLELAPAQLNSLCERLPIPKEWCRLARLAQELRPALEQAERLDAEQLMGLLETSDALRRPGAFQDLLIVAQMVLWSHNPHPARRLHQALAIAQGVKARSLPTHLKGPAIAQALRQARVSALGT